MSIFKTRSVAQTTPKDPRFIGDVIGGLADDVNDRYGLGHQNGVPGQVPDTWTQADKFFARVATDDLVRTNIFIVNIEKPVKRSNISSPITDPYNQTKGTGQKTNGIGGIGTAPVILSNIAGAAISKGADIATKYAQDYLKNNLGRYSNKLLKTGWGEYLNVSGQNQKYVFESYEPQKRLSIMAYNCTIPGSAVDVLTEYSQHNGRNVLITGTSHEPLTITFRSTEQLSEYAYLKDLIGMYYKKETNQISFPDDFVLPTIQVFIYNRETNGIATVIYKDCVITSLSGIDLTGDSSDPVSFTATFEFKEERIHVYDSPIYGLGSVTDTAIGTWRTVKRF